MAEKMVKVIGIDICTEAFGDSTDAPVLLVVGSSVSMLHWKAGFVEKLVAGGAVLEGVGHSMPEEEWSRITGAILRHTAS